MIHCLKLIQKLGLPAYSESLPCTLYPWKEKVERKCSPQPDLGKRVERIFPSCSVGNRLRGLIFGQEADRIMSSLSRCWNQIKKSSSVASMDHITQILSRLYPPSRYQHCRLGIHSGHPFPTFGSVDFGSQHRSGILLHTYSQVEVKV